jgi:predicted MFS family arabinose efflux permease
VTWAFAFNAVSFALYFVALQFIRLTMREPQSRRGRNFFADISEGVAYTLRHPGISILLPVMLLSAICLRGYRDMLAGISDTIYHMGAQGFSILLAATGIGAILSSLYLGNVAKVKGLTNYLIANQAAAVGAIVVFGTIHYYWVGLACSAVLGWCVTTIGIGAQILLQTAVRGEMRGRVMSLWSIVVRAGPALGAQIAGRASESWGFQTPLVALALIFIVPLSFIIFRRGRVAANMEVGPDQAPQPSSEPQTAAGTR